MSETDPRDALAAKLVATRQDEMDCDTFLGHIAALVDDGIAEPRVRELMEHHESICPECAEELAILRRALGREA